MSTRVESSALICATRSDRWCSRRDTVARVDRGIESARHELFDGLNARQLGLAQLADAGQHQGVMGMAGTEAELTSRQIAFDPGSKARQLLQQGFAIAIGGNAASQIGERAFDLQRAARLRTRDRQRLQRHHRHQRLQRYQRYQRHHAIGFDLEQALQHAPGLAWREIMIANQKAREARQPSRRKQRRHRLAVGALTQAGREQGERRDSPWRLQLKRTGPSCAPDHLTPACGGATEKRSHKAAVCASSRSRSCSAISKALKIPGLEITFSFWSRCRAQPHTQFVEFGRNFVG